MAKPHQRRQIGLGQYNKAKRRWDHSIHIRELNMIAGGLGCALWDGSVVFARWIFNHGEVFRDQTVLELGAGCGLPGIVAARFARKVYLTEYIQVLVDNLEYNIMLNSNEEEESSSSDSDNDAVEQRDGPSNTKPSKSLKPLIAPGGIPMRLDLKQTTEAGFLDWSKVPRPDGTSSTLPTQPVPVCSRQKHGRKFIEQTWLHCEDCFPNDAESGCCESCATTCHKGHRLSAPETSKFRCDCIDRRGDNARCVLAEAEPDMPNHVIPKVDIILGAELVYNLLSVDSVANVAEYYLKPDGVFYLVLSNDRDGVSVFLTEMASRGFRVACHAADAALMGNYNTRDWTFQDRESYSFYTFHKAESSRVDLR